MSDKTIKEKIQAELHEWEGRLDRMRLKAHLGKMDAKDKLQEKRDYFKKEVKPVLHKMKDEASESAEEFGEGLAEVWAKAKANLKKAFEDDHEAKA